MSVFIVENGATFAITTPGKVTIDGCAFQSGTTVTTDSENADSRIFNLQGRELKERPRAWNPHRLDDVVNWMTDIELTPPKGENNDYISIIPHYVNDNGKERIDYFDITFKPNETGKQRECVIRTLPYEAIEIGNEMIFVGTAFRVYQVSM